MSKSTTLLFSGLCLLTSFSISAETLRFDPQDGDNERLARCDIVGVKFQLPDGDLLIAVVTESSIKTYAGKVVRLSFE